MHRHDIDLLSFVVGLVFAGIGLALLGGSPVRDSASLVWVGPVVAIGLGILVIIAARPRREEPAEEGSPTEG